MKDDEIKAALMAAFDKIDVIIVPNRQEPYNLDKAMVWFITEPDPYEGLFLKLKD